MYQEIDKIKSKQDFLNFFRLYLKSFHEKDESWKNNNLETFLEGMESWIEDMDGYYENKNEPIPNDFNWKVFADILFASKMYE